MALITSLSGRIRNTTLPKSHALLPVLEAIVNSIQAINALTRPANGRAQRHYNGSLNVVKVASEASLTFNICGRGKKLAG